MTTIGPASQLAAYIRLQLQTTAAVNESSIKRQGDTAVGARDRREAPDRPAEDGALSDTVARRIASIDPSDPDRPRKAFRVFLESVLMVELRDYVVNHPSFGSLVDRVQREMESDAELSKLMVEAGRELLSGETK